MSKHPISNISSQEPNFVIRAEAWNTAAKDYSSAVGLSSAIAMPHLIDKVHRIPPLDSRDACVVEFAPGTGSLTHGLAARCPLLPILATDLSPQMLEELETKIQNSRSTLITTEVVDISRPAGLEKGAYSHVFCTMVTQVLEKPEDPGKGALDQWLELLRPGGVIGIAVWDFNHPCGPQNIWNESTKVVGPQYVSPPTVQPGKWMGCMDMERGMKDRCTHGAVDSMRIGLDVGADAFLRFFWERGNPMAVANVDSFKGDQEVVKDIMRMELAEKYEDGLNIPLYADLGVRIKPLS